MAKPQQDDTFGYVSTWPLVYVLFWACEASVVAICRERMGWRFFSPRKWTYGMLAGLACILGQEAVGYGYQRGVSPVFVLIYGLAGSIQLSNQRKLLRQGVEIHSYSSGWPVIGNVFTKAKYETLKALEILGLIVLAVLSEAAKLPLSFWLGAAALSLLVRGTVDDIAQRQAESDQLDSLLDAEDMARRIRARRGEF